MYLFHLLNFHNKKTQEMWTFKVEHYGFYLDNNFYMDFEMVQSFMMCWLRTWFWLNNILKMVSFHNPLVHSLFVIHYKESCPYQPFLWFGRWFKGHWIPHGIFSSWFATIILVANAHVTKCEKKMGWLMKLLDLMV
jgi:hypothetical protein